jgi:hypothetical protein
MAPARGDLRPCNDAGCAGTMKFGRESENDALRDRGTAPTVSASAPDPMGWICSKDPDHFLKGA